LDAFAPYLAAFQMSGVPSDVQTALVNLGAILLLAQVLAWHYLRFSPVLSNKRKFARTFVFLAATTMLVITIVKTSLALSLGLVGALSIIRFRTPIKEPEELAYLFLAIGLGLGFGAFDPQTAWTGKDLRLITTAVFAGILVYLALVGLRGAASLPPRMLVHVAAENGGPGKDALASLLAAVEGVAPRVDLRRVDTEGTSFQATLVLDLETPDQVGGLLERVREVFPDGTVSVVEGGSLE